MTENELFLKVQKPYYLENFQEIVRYISSCNEYNLLFNKKENTFIQKFNSLSNDGRVLYVRLLTRKCKWIMVNSLSVKDINIDLAIEELVDIGFLDKSFQGSNENRTDLQALLTLLSLPQLRIIYKQTFSSNPKSNKKEDILNKIILHTTRPSFFAKKDSLKNSIIKKCQNLLGNYIMLSKDPMDIFLSLMLLYSLPMSIYEKLEERKNILYQMLLVKINQISYPPYTIQNDINSTLFPTREDFVNFKTLLDQYHQLVEHYERKKYMDCISIYQKTLEILKIMYNSPTTISSEVCEMKSKELLLCSEISIKEDLTFLEELPALVSEKERVAKMKLFLRKFSAYAIFLKIESIVAESYQKIKHYKQAAVLLHHLIGNKRVAPHRRGHWYLRLALVTENYLKAPKPALALVREALEDEYVRTGFRLSIYDRYLSLCPKCNVRTEIMLDLETEPIKKIYITGRLLPKQDMAGKSVFITGNQSFNTTNSATLDGDSASEESSIMSTSDSVSKSATVSLCSVENLALDHYLKFGYTHGIHGEGSIYNTLTILYFWDEIFATGIPDTFRNMFQTCPLDWEYDHFYSARQRAIDAKLNFLLVSRDEDKSAREIKVTQVKDTIIQTQQDHIEKRSETSVLLEIDEYCEKKVESSCGDAEGENALKILLDVINVKWDELCGTSSASKDKSSKIAPVQFPGLNWDVFGAENGKELALSLVKATGPRAFGKIAERLIKDHRHTRGGFPDLTMWNVENNTIKVVEVKGPNDRLSHKQILWLNYLAEIGVDCEVCHVTTTHSKRPKYS